ncbi:MAG: Ig-like domain repeat protein [Methanobrevibacter sp.]|uniref:Ig-like domain repeat protein n=1 Tax=Methanobrevibacter sp. TaxID=66852 RepID=UPI0025CF7B53|nr:Ig-like domain repeat protein [Methanobrevibacter sp.]MBE6497441.1 Ig-like domain repeat protein [Methanobrevibacter sp.]
MKFKKIFIFICLIICLFSIASVCASDANQTAVASDELNQELNLVNADTSSASPNNINHDDCLKVSSENYTNAGENKKSTVIVASDLTTDYKKGDTLTVTLKDSDNNPISGAVLSVELNGAERYTTNANGQIKVPTVNLNAKTYDVSINFAGNDNYTQSSAAVKITVNRIDSFLRNVGDLTMDSDSKAEFTVGIEGATGITAKIDDSDIEVNGLTVSIPQLDAGTHTLTVTTIPDENHNAVSKTTTITVEKAECSITVNDVSMYYNGTSRVKVSPHGAVRVTAKIDDKFVNVDENNEILISGLNAGTHTLTVTAVPDDNHVSVTKTATITVSKIDSVIGVDNINVKYGSDSNITVQTSGAKGFTAKIDGETAEIVGNVVIIPKLDVGTHTLTVTTIPDSNHNPVTKSSTITVIKNDYLSDIRDVTLRYGDSYNMTVNTNGPKFTAKIDGKSVEVSGNKIIFPKLDVGTHTLTVTTVKDANHDSMTKTATILINKAKTKVITANLNGTEGKAMTLIAGTGSVDQVSEGVIIFYEGETKIGEANVDKGIARLSYTPSKAGVYSLLVVYAGTSRFESSSATMKLTVFEKSDDDNESSNIKYSLIVPSGNSTIEINMSSDATGTLTLIIEGVEYKADVVNGICKIPLKDLDDGNYTYTLTYTGDSKYKSFNDIGTLTVNKTKSTTNKTTSKTEIKFPQIGTISAGNSLKFDLPDDATGNITLTVNGETYVYPLDENGKAIVKIPNINAETSPYTITYSGDDKYNSFTRSGTLKSTPTYEPKIIAGNVNVIYSSGSYYTIKVYGTDGKLKNGATVKITGKISKTLTTKNGAATFKITQVPGTYKIKITSLGKTVTKTITVKHVVSLKKVTVKKSAKKLVLQATLSKINGKYLSKKTVTFKFNGKAYKAKTDSKGIAKVTIKSSVLKKLKVGKKVTYQATYLKDTVKNTAQIKK